MQPQPEKFICVSDEAIDFDALAPDTLLAYVEKRDYAIIEPHVLMANRPVVFYMRELSNANMKWVDRQAGEVDKQYAAFQMALVKVDNLRSADGAILNDHEISRYTEGALKGVIRDAELERFEHGQITEIGDAVYMRNVFRRGTRLPCRLPPSWAEHMERMLALRAAQSRALRAQNNSSQPDTDAETSAPSTATTSGPSTLVASSAGPGDVIARAESRAA